MRKRWKAILRGHSETLPSGFDEKEYLRLNPDLAAAKQTGGIRSGAAHWLEFGRLEGRRWNCNFGQDELPQDFDAVEYKRSHPDILPVLEALRITPEKHWHLHGRRENRRGWARIDRAKLPSDFDEVAYRAANPEAAQAIAASQYESGASHWLYTKQKEEAVIAPQKSSDKQSAHDLIRNGFQAAAYAKANADVARHTGYTPEALADHWLHHGFLEGRTAFGLKPYADRRISNAFWHRSDAITVYGLFDARSGLGTAARNYRAALQHAGYDITSVTITQLGDRFESKPDVRAGSKRATAPRQNKVNIFFLNADMMHRFFLDGRLHLLTDSYNIAVWFWELAHFRQDWANTFGALDEIWVSSEFCRLSIEAVSPIPVRIMPQAITIDRTVAPLPRSRFRIDSSVFVFGCVFDVGSLVDRKNPIAAISAFKKAFGDRNDVLLALKYHSAHHYPGEIKKLHSAADGASNIRFYGREFDELENMSFKLALNCLVSPHRSEGFGLNIAEAMLVEKPVIVTNYGGSTDFVTEQTGYPITFSLREIGKQLGPYPADAIWADPDIDHFAEQMSAVFNDQKESASRGERGRQHIEKLYGLASSARRLRDHFDELQIFKPVPPFAKSLLAGTSYTLAHFERSQTNFSVIVPVYNIEPSLLVKCIESVLGQTYADWEIVLHDDGSTRADTISTLLSYKGQDPRIKIVLGEKNMGIAHATNAAVAVSSGKFIALLDNDDELTPDALAEMASAIATNPDADLLYSDEDKIESDGRFSDHYFKPDWSPEHLESVMYLLHFLVVRRSVLLEIGGFRPEFSGAQDYDLALRMSRVARRIVHVPKVLYHWRKIEGSASAQIDAKPEALDRAAKALQNHLDALGRSSKVEPGLAHGLYRVRDKLPPKLPVTLVIFTDNREADVPSRGKINLFDHFIDSILKTTKTDCDIRILAVDNGNLTKRQKDKVANDRGRTVSFQGPRSPFNFSKKANFALSHVETEMVVFLNDDMEVIRPDWIDALMEYAIRPEIGVVGGRLLFPDNSIQHCGVVLGIQNHVAHMYHRQMADAIGYNGYTHIVRNYLAVTGACMATRMTTFDEVGGFDEDLAIDYNDIDFCLRVFSTGYRNVYTPFASLYHFESVTAVRTAPSGKEHALFMSRWADFMKCDPYYNPNLSRQTPDFAPADLSVYR